MHKVQKYILENIAENPREIVKKAAKYFNVSPQSVHKHINVLIREGRITKVGATKAAIYSMVPSNAASQTVFLKQWEFTKSNLPEEHIVWRDFILPLVKRLPRNFLDISNYGVTELINNVKDHSNFSRMEVTVKRHEELIIWEIKDNGIGIFNKIRKERDLHSDKDALLQLSKGRFTTDPNNHSGEGIFFTSRVADFFYLKSGTLKYTRRSNDWNLDILPTSFDGTYAYFGVKTKTRKSLRSVFDEYKKPEDSKFEKTEILVQLSQTHGDELISRSQAKRILAGAEKFKELILDFSGVRTVGQGFVDEVFRVYQNQHPETKISYTKANESVEFMIRRSLDWA